MLGGKRKQGGSTRASREDSTDGRGLVPRSSQLEKSISDFLETTLATSSEEEFLDLKNTPRRVSKMYLNELLAAYQPGALESLLTKLTTFPCPGGRQEMVVLSPIPFISLCAHHVLPFVGEAHVGYIPSDRIIGLSKIPRIVDFFSAKLQVQERLTSEIADFITDYLDPLGVVVYLEARHLCMEARGVRKPGVMTRTSALRGIATKNSVKTEFYRLIRRS